MYTRNASNTHTGIQILKHKNLIDGFVYCQWRCKFFFFSSLFFLSFSSIAVAVAVVVVVVIRLSLSLILFCLYFNGACIANLHRVLSFTLHSILFPNRFNKYVWFFDVHFGRNIHSHTLAHARTHASAHKAKGIQSSFVYHGNGDGGYWVHTTHTRNKHDQMFESFLLLLAPFRLRSLC